MDAIDEARKKLEDAVEAVPAVAHDAVDATKDAARDAAEEAEKLADAARAAARKALGDDAEDDADPTDAHQEEYAVHDDEDD
jgi:hypothetical protein